MSGVRVVVGEAAPAGAGTLRSILQAEGFEVVGQASSAEQLKPVLAAADPQVIVFDAYTTATTVLSARDWAPRAGIVVVWPSSVLAPGADQQVEPARAQTELGDAVRRAVRIRRTLPAVPVALQSGRHPGVLAQRTSPAPSTPQATASPGTLRRGVPSVGGHTVSLPSLVAVSTATILGLGPEATTPVAGNETTSPTTSPGSLSRIPGVVGFDPGGFPGGVGLTGRLSGASERSGATHGHGNEHGHGGHGGGNHGGGNHGAKHDDDGHHGKEGDDRKHSGHGGPGHPGHRGGQGRSGGHGPHHP